MLEILSRLIPHAVNYCTIQLKQIAHRWQHEHGELTNAPEFCELYSQHSHTLLRQCHGALKHVLEHSTNAPDRSMRHSHTPAALMHAWSTPARP
jgi:hypothetical protein